jgi:transketolase
MGRTQDIADIAPLADKFRAFGLHTVEVDGHDCVALAEALRRDEEEPVAIVANTTKGHGVSFMEDHFEWHYLPIREEQYRQAILELNTECEKNSARRS